MFDEIIIKDEHRMIAEMARKFAKEKVAPKAAELDANHRFPEELINEMGKLGLMGIIIP